MKDDQKVELINHEAEQKVDVMIGGKLFTSYCYSDSLMKQILYPILTSSGTPVTRGWPIVARPGERTDHPHHRGLWLNYGNVNGYDFWGNSYEISQEVRKNHDGEIKHIKIEKLSPGTGEGTLVTDEGWITPLGNKIIDEKTEYHFIADGSTRIIDRITSLTADSAILFKDTKEGMFGIRVARELELPAKESITLTDAQGNATTVKALPNEGVTGNYRSSEGITGDSVWSTRAKWMDLYGNAGNEKISLVICDHPKNISYPTYWHARGYGLFAANPFGAKDFTRGKDSLNYSMAAGQNITFRYRVIISSGAHLTNDEINAYADDFAKKY
ncbi:MAG: PmoA family protein [Bacteroidota bacterium]|nr:PmoA family protein [Bacteroidota bacterium]